MTNIGESRSQSRRVMRPRFHHRISRMAAGVEHATVLDSIAHTKKASDAA
jgi:hypothetical protein